MIDKIFFILFFLFITIGQIFIVLKGEYIWGFILSFLGVISFIAGFNKNYMRVYNLILTIFQFVKNIFLNILERLKREKKEIQKNIKTEIKKDILPEKKIKLDEKEKDEKLQIKLIFSKKLLIFITFILFLFAQILIFSQKIYPGIILLFIDLLIVIEIFLMKEERIIIRFTLEKGVKLLLLIFGIVGIIIGWIYLIQPVSKLQNIGVVFTTLGIILAYFGLPENEMKSAEYESEEDILFTNFKIFNNPIIKIILLIIAFISLKIGNIVINHPIFNMYSMIFYGITITAVFFSLPWINFKEKYYENKLLNIIKLLSIILALFIAYKGQILFTKHKVNEAVLYYLLAGAIFIIMFPIYSKKEEDEKVPIIFEVIFLIIIIIVGLFLRIYQLDIRPFGIENDEAGGMVSVVKNFWVGQHPIYAYVWELSYKLFGINRIGLRMAGVMFGMIAIPAMYFALRSVFNIRVAMIVTIIFTFLRWNLHYSRSGHGTIFAIIATTFAVYFIFKAIEKRTKFMYFMAGLATGMCWYGVLTGWLVVIMPVAYFIAKSFTRKSFLEKNIIGILAFLLGFWVFSSQHIHNFFISKKIYFKRIHEVSVFGKDGLAREKNPAWGIVNNTRRVLLMFNYIGDNRQRNSGGRPYEPTIDFVSSIFFGIGFIYAIYYSRYYMFFILVMLFFSQAAGSIFSIEAPSAMRALGTMIPVMFFIALTFEKIWIAFRRVFGKKLVNIIFPVVISIPVFFIVKDNVYQYFGRWIHGMDELATAAGMYAKKLGKSYRIYLYTKLYYPGHPPFRIFRWDYKVNASKDNIDGIVNLSLIDKENYAIFFHWDTWNDECYWRQVFPGVKFDSFSHECCGKFIDVALIDNKYIKNVRGLNAIYKYSDKKVEKIKNSLPIFDKTKDKGIPYKVEWKGLVLIPYYSKVKFINKGNTSINLWIDRHKVKLNSDIILAKGFHNIVIKTEKNKKTDNVQLYMSLQRISGYSYSVRDIIPLNEKYLYSLKNVGLHAYFYSSEDWDDKFLIEERIMPTVYFYGRTINFSPTLKFSGNIKILNNAEYKFIPKGNGYIAIIIDNKYYWEIGVKPPAIKTILNNLKKIDYIKLKKGIHSIKIYSYNTGNLQLLWSVNKERSIQVPCDLLIPDYNITGLK